MISGRLPTTSRRRAVLFAAAVGLALGCEEVVVSAIDAARIDIAPSTATIALSQGVGLSATVLGAGGEVLSGRAISWTSLDEGVAAVDAAGRVTGTGIGTTTIRAVSGDATGSATITVTAGPIISASPLEVSFTAIRNGATPGDRTVAIQNGGGGTLTGLAAAVSYADGAPTGWLTASIAGSAPASLVLSVDQAGLAPGAYTAGVSISSSAAANSPVIITVRLTVSAPPAAIALSNAAVGFAGSEGGPDPAAATVGVTNAGGGALTGLTASIEYEPGGPAGWLAATLNATTAPANLTLQPTIGALGPGTYSAAVRVASNDAQNSPQTVAVTLDVGGAVPQIGLSPARVDFHASVGGSDPQPQTVRIDNVGAGSVTGLSFAVTYPGGQPTAWLVVSLSETEAPATLSLGARTSTLAVGEYSATVQVSSPDAPAGPRSLPVTLSVQPTAPAAPTGLTASPVSETQIDLAWTPPASGGGVSLYHIEARTGGGVFQQIATIAGSATGYRHMGLSPATTWEYRVSAANDWGTSPFTEIASATTRAAPSPPGAPAALAAAAVSDTRIDLSWTAPATGGTVTTFHIEAATGGGAFTGIATVPATATGYSHTGLTASTTWDYRVRASNSDGFSPYSNTASATTHAPPVTPTPPGPPTGLTARPVSESQIDLDWTAPATGGAVREYIVERDDGAGFTEIGRTAALAFSSTGLARGSTYTYRVLASNDDGVSPPSGSASATTLNPPDAPTGLGASVVSATEIRLTWSPPPTGGSVDSYTIEARTLLTPYAVVGTVPAGQTFFDHTGLLAATTYFYRVRAVNGDGASGYSNEDSATTLALPPDAPSNLSAKPLSSTEIELTWDHSGLLVSEFEIESAPAGGTFAPLATVAGSARSYTHSGLVQDTTVQYRVRACGAGCSTVWAGPVSATTLNPPGAPSNLAATGVSDTQIDLTWDPPTSGGAVVNYEIEGSTGGGQFTGIGTATGTSFSHTGLTSGATWTYRLRAFNADGFSPYSATATATTQAPPAPGAPGSLGATAVSSSQIDLGWTQPSTGGPVKDYQIEWRTGTSGQWNMQSVGLVLAWSHTGLSSGTTYSYRVRASNDAGTSSPSNTVTATTTAPEPAPDAAFAAAVEPVRPAPHRGRAAAGVSLAQLFRGSGSSTVRTPSPAASAAAVTSPFGAPDAGDVAMASSSMLR